MILMIFIILIKIFCDFNYVVDSQTDFYGFNYFHNLRTDF